MSSFTSIRAVHALAPSSRAPYDGYAFVAALAARSPRAARSGNSIHHVDTRNAHVTVVAMALEVMLALPGATVTRTRPGDGDGDDHPMAPVARRPCRTRPPVCKAFSPRT